MDTDTIEDQEVEGWIRESRSVYRRAIGLGREDYDQLHSRFKLSKQGNIEVIKPQPRPSDKKIVSSRQDFLYCDSLSQC